jgi:hypothetical protein
MDVFEGYLGLPSHAKLAFCHVNSTSCHPCEVSPCSMVDSIVTMAEDRAAQ